MTGPENIDTKVRNMSKTAEFLTADDYRALGHTPKRPLKIMRLMCLECCCNQPAEVRNCVCDQCVLWPYRMGKNPFRRKSGPGGEGKAAKP